jgi:hypothetical protein
MSRWVRLWTDMPTDPKWRVIAKRAGRPISETLAVFMFMMANAGERNETQCNAAERGVLDNWSDEDVAAALDLETGHVTAIREAMQGKTLEGNKLTGWEKRQPKREDSSTERVRAFRKRSETHGNASEESREESDSDKIREEIQAQPSEQAAVRARRAEREMNSCSKGKAGARARPALEGRQFEKTLAIAEGFALDTATMLDAIKRTKPKNPIGYLITLSANQLKTRAPMAADETLIAVMRGDVEARKLLYQVMP